MFYRLKQANTYAIPVGLFQGQAGFVFKEQIFVDHKPVFYDFANKTALLTEAQVFQKFASE